MEVKLDRIELYSKMMIGLNLEVLQNTLKIQILNLKILKKYNMICLNKINEARVC